MKARLCDLGRLDYEPAWERQKAIHEEVVAGAPDTLLLVEHGPVLTLGANFHEENLLLTPKEYASKGISVIKTDRGGDVTFHGPGQLVVYPIFDIARHGKDLHKWLRDLEECVIQFLGNEGLEGWRFPPHTGVWVGQKKIAAIGIKVRRWVSLHGIALNCDNDLDAFDLIVPCGIQGYSVTSASNEIGRLYTVDEAKPRMAEAFSNVFDLDFE